MTDLLPSAWLADIGSPPHTAQALRDYGLRAPYEWQRLFLHLADLVESHPSAEEFVTALEAEKEEHGETRDAAWALYREARQILAAPTEAALKRLEAALDAFADAVEVDEPRVVDPKRK